MCCEIRTLGRSCPTGHRLSASRLIDAPPPRPQGAGAAGPAGRPPTPWLFQLARLRRHLIVERLAGSRQGQRSRALVARGRRALDQAPGRQRDRGAAHLDLIHVGATSDFLLGASVSRSTCRAIAMASRHAPIRSAVIIAVIVSLSPASLTGKRHLQPTVAYRATRPSTKWARQGCKRHKDS